MKTYNRTIVYNKLPLPSVGVYEVIGAFPIDNWGSTYNFLLFYFLIFILKASNASYVTNVPLKKIY